MYCRIEFRPNDLASPQKARLTDDLLQNLESNRPRLRVAY
jgi:hypothetical protein